MFSWLQWLYTNIPCYIGKYFVLILKKKIKSMAPFGSHPYFLQMWLTVRGLQLEIFWQESDFQNGFLFLSESFYKVFQMGNLGISMNWIVVSSKGLNYKGNKIIIPSCVIANVWTKQREKGGKVPHSMVQAASPVTVLLLKNPLQKPVSI